MPPAVAEHEAAYADAPERVAEHVARAFAPDVAIASPWLERPAVGHEAIAGHILADDERIRLFAVFDGPTPPSADGDAGA